MSTDVSVNLIFSSAGLSVGAVVIAGVLVRLVVNVKAEDSRPVVVIRPMIGPKS
jgi:hypothetical protein